LANTLSHKPLVKKVRLLVPPKASFSTLFSWYQNNAPSNRPAQHVAPPSPLPFFTVLSPTKNKVGFLSALIKTKEENKTAAAIKSKLFFLFRTMV